MIPDAQRIRDLDFTISRASVTLRGISPAGLAGVEYQARQSSAVGESTLEETGFRPDMATAFVISARHYDTLPGKGAILEANGIRYAVRNPRRDRPANPIKLTLEVTTNL